MGRRHRDAGIFARPDRDIEAVVPVLAAFVVGDRGQLNALPPRSTAAGKALAAPLAGRGVLTSR